MTRWWIVRLSALCTVLLLGGCTGVDERAETGTDGATTGTFPVTVEHIYGSTVIEQAPRRVAALGFGDQDVLLSLGVIPVVANQFVPSWTNGIGPWGLDLLGDARPVPIDGNEPNLETILAQQPDLVIAANLALDQATYDALSAVVPVVAGPVGFDAYSIPWQDHTRHVGAAVGLAADADRVISEVEAQVRDAAVANPGLAGNTAQVLTALPEVGNIRAYTATARGYLLESLGLDVPDWVDAEAGDRFYVDISAESAGRLEADAVVFLGPRADFDSQPLLVALPAAERGSVVFLDEDTAVALAAPGPLTIPYVLDTLVPGLNTAVAAG